MKNQDDARRRYETACRQYAQAFFERKKFLVWHLRNKNRIVATFLAVIDNHTETQIGWSKCSKNDSFSRPIGLWKAIQRLCGVTRVRQILDLEIEWFGVKIPHAVRQELEDFIVLAKTWTEKQAGGLHVQTP